MDGRKSYAAGRPVVAIRHIRLDGDTLLSPGEELPAWCPEHYTLALFRQGRVAMKDCPWAEMMLRVQGVGIITTSAPVPAKAARGKAARGKRDLPVLTDLEASGHET